MVVLLNIGLNRDARSRDSHELDEIWCCNRVIFVVCKNWDSSLSVDRHSTYVDRQGSDCPFFGSF